jgi:hypothetical protein
MLFMRIRLYFKNMAAILVLLILSLTTTIVCFADDEQIGPIFNSYLTKTVSDERTYNLGGQLCAIAHDTHGNLYVAKNGDEIVKVNYYGKVKPVYKLDSLSSGTYIRSLKTAKDGTLYVAATDRLFKIAPDGKATTLINDPDVKPTSVELDQKGNMYVISGMKVFKYNAALEKSLFIDCGGTRDLSLELTDLKFDFKAKNMYIANGQIKQVYKYPIQADGNAGKQQIIVDLNELGVKINPFNHAILGTVNPSWLAVNCFGDLYVSLENTGSILEISANGNYILYQIDPKFSNATIVNQMSEHKLYIIGKNDGKVHRIDPIGEDNSSDD